MTIEEQAQILSEAVAETRAARHHYQGDIKEEERRMRTEDEGKSSGVAKAGLPLALSELHSEHWQVEETGCSAGLAAQARRRNSRTRRQNLRG